MGANSMAQSPVKIVPALALVFEVLTVCLLGLMAGFFFAFAIDVAPAMTRLDATAYITTQQWINAVVRNAGFGAAYFGAAACPFATAALVWAAGRRVRGWMWLLLALAYISAVFWVTSSVNVPINNALATWSAAAPPPDWQQARDIWNQSNLIRTLAAGLCFLGSVLLLATPRREAGVLELRGQAIPSV